MGDLYPLIFVQIYKPKKWALDFHCFPLDSFSRLFLGFVFGPPTRILRTFRATCKANASPFCFSFTFQLMVFWFYVARRDSYHKFSIQWQMRVKISVFLGMTKHVLAAPKYKANCVYISMDEQQQQQQENSSSLANWYSSFSFHLILFVCIFFILIHNFKILLFEKQTQNSNRAFL